MARKRRTGRNGAGELNLVAMIDVAFQLLSFFLITVVPHDVMTNIMVTRPSPPIPPTEPRPPQMSGYFDQPRTRVTLS